MISQYETRLNRELRKASALFETSRRGFLKGAGAGVATAALASSGVALADEAAPAEASASWRDKPEPVDESSIVETVDVDVLVVGAGTAGTAAYASACEEIEATGNKVLLIEKGVQGDGIRTSGMGFINTRLSEKYGVNIDRKAYVLDHLKYNLNFCDTRLLQTFANESGFVGNWLMDICEADGVVFGFEYNQGTPYNYAVWQTGHFPSAVDAEGNEVSTDVDTPMLSYAEKLGGEYRTETALQYLEQDETGRVTGVIATNPDGDNIRINAAKGVFVATGGYAVNFDIYRDRQPAIFKTLTMAFGFPGCTGDGFRAMLWAGAEPTDMPSSMLFDRGILKPEDQPGDPVIGGIDATWTFSSQPWLKVNALGERFTCESCLYDMIIHAALYQPGKVYYDIWDSDWANQIDSFQTVGCSEIVKRRGGCDLDVYYTDTASDEEFAAFVQGEKDEIQAQMDDLVERGYIVKADTVEELAEGLGLPAETLAATVARYNELAQSGVDEDFGKEKHRLLELTQPPYYGSKMGSWVLCTADGIKQSPKHEALDADGNPIPGLYVGGVDGGSIFANSYPNLSSGMCCGHSVTFGYRAGKIISHNDEPDYELSIPITY